MHVILAITRTWCLRFIECSRWVQSGLHQSSIMEWSILAVRMGCYMPFTEVCDAAFNFCQDTFQDSSATLLSAMILTFLSSVFSMPKNLAISMIWFGLTKSVGFAQNLSIPGANSRHFIVFGILRPTRHSPFWERSRQKSQIIISLYPLRMSMHHSPYTIRE